MINSLRLRYFRSYRDESFEFDDGVNIIVGPNASGKTNLIEGILILCQGRSYRGSDKDLIKHGKNWAKISGETTNGQRSVSWNIEEEKAEKEYQIGGLRVKRFNYQHALPVVIFEPSHLQLLTDSPSLRREFLDDIIEKTKPGFGLIRRSYKRAVAQRNSLLKQNKPNEEIFVWDVRISELGGSILKERNEFIDEHQATLAKLYNKIAGKRHQAGLIYKTKLAGNDYPTSLLKALQKQLALDKELGFTTRGPHRDDVVPMLGGHELIGRGSRGEVRTMLLALKLLELQAVEKASQTKPILLLDDVFSELDGARRRALTDYLKDRQTFITTTDADIVVQHFMGRSRVIPVSR